MTHTDHNSIVWLTCFKNILGKLARWLEELSQYDFRVIHRRGSEHINADRLLLIEDPLEVVTVIPQAMMFVISHAGDAHIVSELTINGVVLPKLSMTWFRLRFAV